MADTIQSSDRFIHPQSLAANKPISEQESDNNRDNKNNNVRRIHFPLNYKGIILTPQPAVKAPTHATDHTETNENGENTDDNTEKLVTEEKQQLPHEEYIPPVYTKITYDTIAHINNGSLHHQHTIQHNTQHTPEYPKAYKSNTPYETQLLEYINDYRLQYITLFPQRKPLLFTCQNECNVTKAINTYIKPTLLPYTNICDIQSAAQLVADIITYKTLPLPCELPVTLNTSSTVINKQSGNSLEMSILLASFLIGMNYNVYVVSGYATQAVCNNDQSNTQCIDLHENTVIQPKPQIDFGSYTKLIQPKFSSKFVHSEKVRTHLNTIQLQNATDQAEREKLLDERKVIDKFANQRIHFWLLVLPDSTHVKSDVTEPIFIETSTGTAVSISDATAYVGVESVFNHTSYYINMKHTAPCTALQYELHDIKLWDCMTGNTRGSNSRTDSVSNIRSITTRNTQLQHTIHSIQWIQPIVISKNLYECRYPTDIKHTKYYCCDCYHYNKYSQPDSVVTRYIVYNTDRLGFETTTVKYIKSIYYNRKDKLIESIDNKLTNTLLYTFDTGLTSGLHTYESTSTQETYIFYDNTRIDRLCKRICNKLNHKNKLKSQSNSTITEYYNTRTDRLQQRTLTVTSDTTQHQLHTIQLNYSNIYSITILNIHEIYERNIEVIDPALDISSVTYDLIHNTIDIKSHHINTQLHGTIATKILQAKTIQLKNLKHTIKEHELSIYDITTTIESIVNTPNDTVVSVIKTMSETIDDIIASGVQNDTGTNESNTIQQLDYLKSFIDKYVPATQTQPWTNNQKQSIRESALSVYKQTLLDRSNIINDHIDTLKQQLQSVTQQYKRNVNNTVNQAEITELQFQLQVLQDRKTQFEQAVLKKYIAFDQKLSMDPRLQMS